MTTDDVFALFVRDYLLFAFLGALGAIQLGAARGRLRGLLLVPGARTSGVLGITLLLAGAGYFFLSPLWIEGPWAAEFGGIPPGESERRISEWGTASWDNLARARIVNDIHGGLHGSAQALLFALAAAVALLVNLFLATVRVRLGSTASRRRPRVSPETGMDMLSSTDYLTALSASLRYWLANGAARLKREASGLWAESASHGGLGYYWRRLRRR